jgi:hypothetical protein
VVSVGKRGVTLVPGRGSLRDAAIRDLLRVADLRGALPAPAARMLHRLARGQFLPQSRKRDERVRLSVLLRGGCVTVGEGARAGANAVGVHPDVRFSLALDEGYASQAAAATAQPPVRRRPFPWPTDQDSAGDEEAPGRRPTRSRPARSRR